MATHLIQSKEEKREPYAPKPPNLGRGQGSLRPTDVVPGLAKTGRVWYAGRLWMQDELVETFGYDPRFLLPPLTPHTMQEMMRQVADELAKPVKVEPLSEVPVLDKCVVVIQTAIDWDIQGINVWKHGFLQRIDGGERWILTAVRDDGSEYSERTQAEVFKSDDYALAWLRAFCLAGRIAFEEQGKMQTSTKGMGAGSVPIKPFITAIRTSKPPEKIYDVVVRKAGEGRELVRDDLSEPFPIDDWPRFLKDDRYAEAVVEEFLRLADEAHLTPTAGQFDRVLEERKHFSRPAPAPLAPAKIVIKRDFAPELLAHVPFNYWREVQRRYNEVMIRLHSYAWPGMLDILKPQPAAENGQVIDFQAATDRLVRQKSVTAKDWATGELTPGQRAKLTAEAWWCIARAGRRVELVVESTIKGDRRAIHVYKKGELVSRSMAILAVEPEQVKAKLAAVETFLESEVARLRSGQFSEAERDAARSARPWDFPPKGEAVPQASGE